MPIEQRLIERMIPREETITVVTCGECGAEQEFVVLENTNWYLLKASGMTWEFDTIACLAHWAQRQAEKAKDSAAANLHRTCGIIEG